MVSCPESHQGQRKGTRGSPQEESQYCNALIIFGIHFDLMALNKSGQRHGGTGETRDIAIELSIEFYICSNGIK
jgi:hypothetical protein